MKPSFTLIDNCVGLSVLLRLQVYSRIFATTIDFQFEIEPVTFVKRCHASTLYRADMYKSIGLPIIALNKAKAFHSIEELDRATRLFSRELALGSTIIPTKAASVLGWSSRRPISHGQGFTLDLQVGSGHFAAAVDQCKFEGLSFGKTGQSGLLDRADVHEHVFAAVIANDEAKTLLSIEEFYNAFAFTDDLPDRKSVVMGKSGSVRLDLVGRRNIKKQINTRESKQN